MRSVERYTAEPLRAGGSGVGIFSYRKIRIHNQPRFYQTSPSATFAAPEASANLLASSRDVGRGKIAR